MMEDETFYTGLGFICLLILFIALDAITDSDVWIYLITLVTLIWIGYSLFKWLKEY